MEVIIRTAEEKDHVRLAEMKWQHCAEDDEDYGESNLKNADRQKFISEFTDFLKANKNYEIWTAEADGTVVSAMFVYLVPKVPKPNGNSKYIAYLTNVFTVKEYRNKTIGTQLLNAVKKSLTEKKCELVFVFPSDNSVNWYVRNGFYRENEMFECDLNEE